MDIPSSEEAPPGAGGGTVWCGCPDCMGEVSVGPRVAWAHRRKTLGAGKLMPTTDELDAVGRCCLVELLEDDFFKFEFDPLHHPRSFAPQRSYKWMSRWERMGVWRTTTARRWLMLTKLQTPPRGLPRTRAEASASFFLFFFAY